MDKSQAIEWLKNFIKEIDTQDNRATASPIQFLLQQKRKYVAHDEFNYQTESIWRHSEMESTECKTYEEAVEWLKEYGYTDERLEREIEQIEEFKMGHYWETNQAFLTEKGLKEHIKLNRHNLGEYRDYVVYSFRNPEMKNLFEAIRVIINPTQPSKAESEEG